MTRRALRFFGPWAVAALLVIGLVLLVGIGNAGGVPEWTVR